MILAQRGAKVFILDLNAPVDDAVPQLIEFKKCNVTVWSEPSSTFLEIGHVDLVFANAGISEEKPFLQAELDVDEEGLPVEPEYPVLDVNLRSVLNVIKLSWSMMTMQSDGGSIVITSSSTAYAPELGLIVH